MRGRPLICAALILLAGCVTTPVSHSGPVRYAASTAKPPAIPREFRGAWVASVFNIDWPSSAGLSASRQKSELLAIFDQAAELRLNAVILQVRPACDALYASNIEPWSRWLTGTMGRSPGYDPLKFAVAEARARGLELHAWFNPFRALASEKTKATSDHITRRQPSWVRRYEGKVWLDPGIPEVRAHALRVIMDVVKRYDIDGVHIDDYFYPYPKKPKARPVPEFPDMETFRRHGSGSRHDWRRANINSFVSQLYRSVKGRKPWVKVGISPFGIWKPGVPSSIKADLDAHDMIFGDSRAFLRNGWCDYFSPQLYWPIAGDQSYSTLIKWWDSQNSRRRHIWPGIAADRIGVKRSSREHGRQIDLARARGRASSGHVHWSWKAIAANKRGVATMLAKEHYRQTAMIPSLPWLATAKPGKPSLRTSFTGETMYLNWTSSGGAPVARWYVQNLVNGVWLPARVSPAGQKGLKFEPGSRQPLPEMIAVTAVDRYGNASAPTVIARR